MAISKEPLRRPARELLLRVLSVPHALEQFEELARHGVNVAERVQAAVIVGTTEMVRWLIPQLSVPKIARHAGHALAAITGVELATEHLAKAEQDEPALDDAEDDDEAVELDEDGPAPDLEKVEAWWQRNQARFKSGVRYFGGRPLSAEAAEHFLQTGTQRQRTAAARWLAVLHPGLPPREPRSPAWRQGRSA